ncbi:MAG: AarF/ABC1/UbiB kinase family protein [Cyanobacteria bacterium TGS_CYA1]|nr:AarF/ABC1/UbiB kinase family protein [Cyanobacteria bacterium TGS_CYA1]
MQITFPASQLKRFKDLGFFLFKYGNPEELSQLGITEILHPENMSKPVIGDGSQGQLLDDLSADLEKAGPTFIRIAQQLSKRPGLMPSNYIEALASLNEARPAMNRDELSKIFLSEFGKSIETLFSSFDYYPISSSVFFQTHRATKSSGKRVVVKIMRPGILESTSADLHDLGQIVEFLNKMGATKQFDYKAIFSELQIQIHAELDFRQEVQNLRILKENLAELDHIIVPSPVEHLCSQQVLTTEYIDGIPLSRANLSGLLSAERATLAQQVFHAFLRQYLVDGFVHSSFKLENIYFTSTGNIALLDMGAVVHISKRVQQEIIKLLMALNDGRGDTIATLLPQIGLAKENFDESAFRQLIEELVMITHSPAEGRLEVARVFVGIGQAVAKFGITLPSELTFFSNALVAMDKVSDIIDPNFDSRTFLKKNISMILRDNAIKSFSVAHFFESLMESIRLLEKMPAKVGKILDSAADNEFKITVQAIDERILISGFQKIANRITVGLILAALIMGAAQLMQVQTKFQIWGYPGLAILCFLAAAICGFALVIEVLVSDRLAERKQKNI